MQAYAYILLLFSLACLLVVISPFISFFCLLKTKKQSIKQSLLSGALSGLIGTLIWPTGYLIWYCIANMSQLQMGGIVVVSIAVLIIGSMALGAAISAVLTFTLRSQ
jgi:hypothetical protein